METALIILAVALTLTGLLGCILPALPGPPLNYAALLCLQAAFQPFTVTFLVVFGIIVAVVTVLDFMLPVYTAKRFGATKYGVWGSIIGMLLGIVFTPVGMILGLLLGAIIGDVMAGRTLEQSLKSGAGTFAGTMLALVIKLALSGVMTFFVFYEIAKYLF